MAAERAKARRPDGDLVALRRRVAELERENRQLRERVTARADAPEQKKALEEARKFKTVFDRAGYGAAIAERSGNLLYVNDVFAHMHGYEPAELVGQHLSIFHSEPQMERVNHLLRRLTVEGTFVGEEVWHVRKDGVEFLTLMNGTRICDDEGRVLYWAATITDLTERKRLEEKLRESEQRYRTVVESAGEVIAIVDEQGVFRFMNSTAGKRLGGAAADFIGKNMRELFPPEVAVPQMDHIAKVIRTGQGSSEISPSMVRGELRWYNTTVEPLDDPETGGRAALVIARDIHELKQAQDELAAYRERMIRAEQLASLGTLSATLAHELTQPLTVVRLSLQNALATLSETACPATLAEDLHDGLDELSRVTAVVERFRRFARRSSETVVKRVALSEIARRVIRLLQESAREQRVALEWRGFENLPPIAADEKEMEQMFFALAQNAIQAADGARGRHFCITGVRRDNRIELQFTDDCGGIAPEHLDHIFEPFFTTKPPDLGTGLGLCIVQRIVSQAGGHLHVDNRWGQGTTFLVALPIEGL